MRRLPRCCAASTTAWAPLRGRHCRLLVADAGAPRVHVFAASANGWTGAAYPVATIDVMDEPTLPPRTSQPGRGRAEGDRPRPRDADPARHVRGASVRVFDVAEVLERPERVGIDGDVLLRHELAALAAARAEREATASARAELAAVLATKAWRLTAPARRLYAMLGRICKHRSAPRDALTD